MHVFLQKLFLEIYFVPLKGPHFPIALYALWFVETGYLNKQPSLSDFTAWYGKASLISRLLSPETNPRSRYFLGVYPVRACACMCFLFFSLIFLAAWKCLNFPESLISASSWGLRYPLVFLFLQSLAPTCWLQSSCSFHALIPVTVFYCCQPETLIMLPFPGIRLLSPNCTITHWGRRQGRVETPWNVLLFWMWLFLD